MFHLFTRKPVASGPVMPGPAFSSPGAGDHRPLAAHPAEGLPAVDVASVVRVQAPLIGRVRDALRLNRDEFERLARPVIEAYAAYVHLLPVTESHHHSGAGGLFYHGLEVGFWAAQCAESHSFQAADLGADTPWARREGEPRWQFAAFLAGLLHDVGKPLSGLVVTDMTGQARWNPYETGLADWCQKKRIERYCLHWREPRNRHRERFSLMNLGLIVTPEARAYLNAPGPYFMEAMVEAIAGIGASDLLTRIVLWAERESVRLNSPPGPEPTAAVSGAPTERLILEALRRFAVTANCNEPGALIWRLEQGVFLVWHGIAPILLGLMAPETVAGLPRDPDRLADVLIDSGFATACPEGGRYWRINPEDLHGMPLNGLMLEDPTLIFDREPPPPVRAGVHPPPGIGVRPTSATPSTQPEASAEAAPAPETAASGEAAPTADIPVDDPSVPTSVPENPVAEQSPPDAELAEEAETLPAEEAQTEPESEHSPGWSIIHLALQRSSEGKPSLERLPDGDYGIPYPRSACFLGEPKSVMNTLAEEGLLRHDPASSSKTTLVAGKKYLVLCRHVSRFVSEQIEACRGGGSCR